jgi:hypothetical protein
MSDVDEQVENPMEEPGAPEDEAAPVPQRPVEAIQMPMGQTMRVPLVKIETAEIRLDSMPNGNKVMLIGPVMLALPLSPENQRFLKEQMSGIVIAAPGDLLKRDV